MLMRVFSQAKTPTHRLTRILYPNATRLDPATYTLLATERHRPPTATFFPPITILMYPHYPSSRSVVARTSFQIHARRIGGSTFWDVDADLETDCVQGEDGGRSGGGDVGDLEHATTGGLSLANDDEMARLPLRVVAYRTRAAEWDPRHRARLESLHTGSSVDW